MSIEKPSKANPSMPPPIPLGQTAIPITRIQRIVKTDKEVNKIAADAAFLITKATELFVDNYVAESYKLTKRDKRRTLQYKDLAKSATTNDVFEFLMDIIPEKRTVTTKTNSKEQQQQQ